MKNDSIEIAGALGAIFFFLLWIVAIFGALALPVVIIWAIIRLVAHFCGVII